MAMAMAVRGSLIMRSKVSARIGDHGAAPSGGRGPRRHQRPHGLPPPPPRQPAAVPPPRRRLRARLPRRRRRGARPPPLRRPPRQVEAPRRPPPRAPPRRPRRRALHPAVPRAPRLVGARRRRHARHRLRRAPPPRPPLVRRRRARGRRGRRRGNRRQLRRACHGPAGLLQGLRQGPPRPQPFPAKARRGVPGHGGARGEDGHGGEGGPVAPLPAARREERLAGDDHDDAARAPDRRAPGGAAGGAAPGVPPPRRPPHAAAPRGQPQGGAVAGGGLRGETPRRRRRRRGRRRDRAAHGGGAPERGALPLLLPRRGEAGGVPRHGPAHGQGPRLLREGGHRRQAAAGADPARRRRRRHAADRARHGAPPLQEDLSRRPQPVQRPRQAAASRRLPARQGRRIGPLRRGQLLSPEGIRKRALRRQPLHLARAGGAGAGGVADCGGEVHGEGRRVQLRDDLLRAPHRQDPVRGQPPAGGQHEQEHPRRRAAAVPAPVAQVPRRRHQALLARRPGAAAGVQLHLPRPALRQALPRAQPRPARLAGGGLPRHRGAPAEEVPGVAGRRAAARLRRAVPDVRVPGDGEGEDQAHPAHRQGQGLRLQQRRQLALQRRERHRRVRGGGGGGGAAGRRGGVGVEPRRDNAVAAGPEQRPEGVAAQARRQPRRRQSRAAAEVEVDGRGEAAADRRRPANAEDKVRRAAALRRDSTFTTTDARWPRLVRLRTSIGTQMKGCIFDDFSQSRLLFLFMKSNPPHVQTNREYVFQK